jgi:hypothetical protein
MDTPDKDDDPLNRRVSIVVAIAATFLSICNVKDSNIVQAMQAAQAEVINEWSYFQAKSTKQQIAEAAVQELEAFRSVVTEAEAGQKLDAMVAGRKADVARYEVEKKDIQTKAHDAEKTYAELNLHDDQFDISEASLSLSIALMGITALTRQKWLLVLGAAFAAFGVFMGGCGFFGLSVHPDFLARLLS